MDPMRIILRTAAKYSNHGHPCSAVIATISTSTDVTVTDRPLQRFALAPPFTGS